MSINLSAHVAEVCDIQGCGQDRGEFIVLPCSDPACPCERLLCLDCASALGYEIR